MTAFKRDAVIIDCGLSHSGGHHSGFLLRVISHFELDTSSVTVLCSALMSNEVDVGPRTDHGLSVKPLLQATGYEGFADFYGTAVQRVESQCKAGEALTLDFLRFDYMLENTSRIIILNSTLATIRGLAGWLSMRGEKLATPLFLHILSGVGVCIKPIGVRWRLVETDDFLHVLFSSALQMISKQAPRASILVNSDVRKLELRSISGLPIDVLPFQGGVAGIVLGASEKNVARPEIILYSGDAKWEKGLARLPNILLTLAERFPKMHFFTQINDPTGRFSEICDDVLGAARYHTNIRVHLGWMDASCYARTFASAKAVVFLHTVDGYHDKGSGLSEEADFFDVPIICRIGTEIERERRLSRDSRATHYFSREAELGNILEELFVK